MRAGCDPTGMNGMDPGYVFSRRETSSIKTDVRAIRRIRVDVCEARTPKLLDESSAGAVLNLRDRRARGAEKRRRCPAGVSGTPKSVLAPRSIQLASRRFGRSKQRGRAPFRLVDERVAVAMEAVDHFVALAFGDVHWVGLLPGDQRGQQAHVDRRAGGDDD